MRTGTVLFVIVIVILVFPLYVQAGDYIYVVPSPNMFGARGRVVQVTHVRNSITNEIIRQSIVLDIAGSAHSFSCGAGSILYGTDNIQIPGLSCSFDLVLSCPETQISIGSTVSIPDPDGGFIDVVASSVRCVNSSGPCMLLSGSNVEGVFAIEDPHLILTANLLWIRPASHCSSTAIRYP